MIKNKLAVSVLCSLISFTAFAEDEIDKQCVPESEWRSYSGEKYNNKDVLHSLSKTRVVMLGEDHDNVEHHRWQLQTIVELFALEPGLVLGFEAFPRSTQRYLDQFVAGELNEKAFLEAVDWEKIWRFNKDYYMPMFHFARMNRIPMYALNVDRSLVSIVSQNGWDNVPLRDREGITNPADPSQEYQEMLAGVFAQHMPKHAHKQKETTDEHDSAEEEMSKEDLQAIIDNPSFQKFIQGQLVWDRAMAEMFYQAVEKDKKPLIVGVLGAGHIMGGYGAPHQLRSMGVKNIKTLMAWDGTLDCDQLKEGAVDLAFGIKVVSEEEKAEDERPRLGVYLEHDDGVKITKIVPDSVAAKSGVMPDDKIITIAGKPATKVADVVTAVKTTAFGTWLPLTIERDGKKIQLVAKFPAR